MVLELEKQLETMVLACIDTAKAMLDEYGIVVPFGLRAYNDSKDMKMNCPAEKDSTAGWEEQIETVVEELRRFVATENISATMLVTSMQSGDESGVGLQIETQASSVLFVYPYSHQNQEWVIEEPVETDQLFSSVYNNEVRR